MRFALKISSLFLATLLLPVGVFAAPEMSAVVTPDDQTVSRGEFIRAAIVSLDIMPSWKGKLPYTRPVPKNLLPYVGTAHDKGALKPFGKDLGLARGITRGEAVQVLVGLLKATPQGTAMSFTDVQKGSDLEKAVRVAIEKEWMQPLRRGYFGADRVLSGREAKVLLKRVTGQEEQLDESGAVRVPAIQIQLQKKNRPDLPNQDLLRTIWQLLNDQYLYSEKLNGDEAAYKAAEGLVKSLNDPYTTFMPPVPASEFRTQLEGEVTGIGAQVELKDSILTIVAPLPGSPAEKAGLKPGDQILKVNGESLEGLGFIESVSKVRGPRGSTAKLSIRRNGENLEYSVIRDTIKVPEIEVSWQGNTAVVKLIQFGQRTEHELRSQLEAIQLKRPNALILDLRNNPGGLLDAATITLSNFLPKGSVVAKITSRDDEYFEKTDDEPTLDSSVPMVVLVNKGSASASEIVAGALQDADRATLVGETTFGKGTVQQVMEFRDGSGLKLTIAEWFTPANRKIDGVGVSPDLEVIAVEGRDEQMLKALELLR
jgi:carboxyl-terminal processing protease